MFDKLMGSQKKAKKEAEEKQLDLDQLQDDRCFPIVEMYYELLNDYKIKLGKTTFEEKKEYAEPIVSEMLNKCLDANLKVADVKYIDQLVKKVHEDIFEILANSVNRSLAICSKDYWKVDDDAIDFKRIDDKLKDITERSEKS